MTRAHIAMVGLAMLSACTASRPGWRFSHPTHGFADAAPAPAEPDFGTMVKPAGQDTVVWGPTVTGGPGASALRRDLDECLAASRPPEIMGPYGSKAEGEEFSRALNACMTRRGWSVQTLP